MRTVARGLAAEMSGDAMWRDLPVALIDVETTGRDASVDRVVELGIAVGQGGEVVRRHNWLINPGRTIPDEVRAVHGISDEDVKDAPRFEVVVAAIAEALAGCIPAAYNAPFDRAFVTNEFARSGYKPDGDAPPCPALRREVEWIDPLVWARELQRDERSKTLIDVAARLGITHENAHRASDDAEAALRVMYALATDDRVPKMLAPFIQEQRRLAQLQADERRRWRS
jgi:DNA polymerase-3 subunit epsilon